MELDLLALVALGLALEVEDAELVKRGAAARRVEAPAAVDEDRRDRAVYPDQVELTPTKQVKTQEKQQIQVEFGRQDGADCLNDAECNQELDRDRREVKLGIIHGCTVNGVRGARGQGNQSNMGARALQHKQQEKRQG